MRKHFLILMLLALLPFVAWADAVDVTISVKNLTATYGELGATECPTLTATDIAILSVSSGTVQKNDIIPHLQVSRVQNGYVAGQYEISVEQFDGTDNYNIIVTNSPKLTIKRKDISWTAVYAKNYDGAVMGTQTVTASNATTLLGNELAAKFVIQNGFDSWSDINLQIFPTGTDATKTAKGVYNSTVNATISEAAQANYNFVVTKGALTINARPISSDDKFTVQIDGPTSVDYAAAGHDVPGVIVKFNNTALEEGEQKDYTVSWNPAPVSNKFTDAKTYTATITGKGNFDGTKTTTFKINGQPLTGAVVTLTLPDGGYVYSNTAYEPAVQSIRIGSTDLNVNDFTVSWENNKKAGTATVTVTGKDNTTYFNKSASTTFEIAPFDLSLLANNVSIAAITDVLYNTKAQEPTPVVTIGGTTSISGNLPASTGSGTSKVINWTATYENNVNVSTSAYAKVIVTGQGNYTGSIEKSFTINAKPFSGTGAIAESDFASYANETYTGMQIKPATTGKVKFTHTAATSTTPAQIATLVEGVDYTVTYGTNHDAANNGGSITYTGKGNYTGTKTVTFNITQKPLTITAKSYIINYGATRPAFEVEYDGLVASDLTTTGAPAAGVFTTAPEVKQCALNTTSPENTTNAGTYSLVIFGESSTAHHVVAPNYSINALTGYVDGSLVINANLVTLKVKNKKVAYGTVEPVYTIAAQETDGTVSYNQGTGAWSHFYELEAVGEIPGATLAQLTQNNSFTFTREEAATKTVGTYNIKVNGPAVLAGGYNVTYQDGTLEIEKLKLRAVAQNKSIAWNSGEPAMAVGYDNIAQETNIKFQTYVDNDATKALTNVVLPNITGVADVAQMSDVVSKIEWVNEAGTAYTSGWTKGHPGTIKVTLKADLSAFTPNYDIAGIDGKVTFTGLDLTELVLDGAANQFATIQGIDNLKYTSVKVKTGRTGAREIKAKKWNAYILPFKTSVAEISRLAGIDYAIVNVIDAENSSANNIKFKLWMGDIEANTPFCMKTLVDLPGTTVLDFGTKTIKAPTSASVEKPIGETGVSFIGCYDSHDILAANQNENYCFNDGWYTASSVYDVKPLEAYLKKPATNNARLEITFEEADGSTTAITTIAAEGVATKANGWYTLDGIKLQSAPVEKGVYINNGKKVVIK